MDLDALYGLRVRTPRLELRWPTKDELQALVQLAGLGIHSPDEMPFRVPWTDPSDTFESGFLGFYRELRTNWRQEDWDLELAVFADGELIGVQGVLAKDFTTKRCVETGSWLGQRFQRRGYGTEMRAAALHLAFVGLDALEARTAAMDFNVASQRVSRKLGYSHVGEAEVIVRDRTQREFLYRLPRHTFLDANPFAVEIVGLDKCLKLFGSPIEPSPGNLRPKSGLA